MERITRSAVQRVRELISRGFNLKEYEEHDQVLLSDEEEDEIDAQLLGINNSEETILQDKPEPGHSGRAGQNSRYCSYEDEDVDLKLKDFKPCRPPGPHLGDRITCLGAATCSRAIDFFQLFFTEQVMEMLCSNTNLYTWLHILDKPTYGRKSDGAWDPVDEDEMRRFIALIIMMGFIVMPDLSRYWSQATLYSGGWAQRLMSRNRFKALLAMIHVADPDKEDQTDKLTKVRCLIDHMKETSQRLYQPDRNLSIDERMVRSKGRSGIRQFMPNKPVRFGYKFWCLCEPGSGYTLDFNVYTGRRETPSKFGLAYDVVMNLISKFQNQNYRVFMDNYYTSMSVVKELLKRGVYSCGTTLPRRKGFPQALKDCVWVRTAKRGQMRYCREDDVLCLQWQDNKPVCVCSTLHRGHEFSFVQRHTKEADGSFRLRFVRKPKSIQEYNMNMGGVDLADQMLQNYNVLLKSTRWWKTIFFHLIDVAVLNAFILFKKWQAMHPEVVALQRPAGYSHLHFREELVHQLGSISDDERPPVLPFQKAPPKPAAKYHCTHMPQYKEARNNCRVCYLTHGKEVKTNWMCADEDCGVYVCLNKDKNCMAAWHSPEFDHIREGRYRHTH